MRCLTERAVHSGIYLDDMESGWVVEDNVFETIHMVSTDSSPIAYIIYDFMPTQLSLFLTQYIHTYMWTYM